MKGGRIGLGLANNYVNIPRPVTIRDDNGIPLKALDVDCGYVHSLIVAVNGTVHMCGGVGIDGDNDGQTEEEENTPGGDNEAKKSSGGQPRRIRDFNIWHRVPEPKEQIKKEKWKKYGTYEVKGRSKMMAGDD
jgi:alpha-tubulin suppressor-like RCC1 family protein